MATAFDGKWTRGVISGTTLTFDNGLNVSMEILAADKFAVECHGEKHTAVLENDGRLHWDDNDIWELEQKYQEAAEVSTKKARFFGMGFGKPFFLRSGANKNKTSELKMVNDDEAQQDETAKMKVDDPPAVENDNEEYLDQTTKKEVDEPPAVENDNEEYLDQTTKKEVDEPEESSMAMTQTRHDFGMGFGTCTFCQAKWVLKRGCKDTNRVICNKCWPDYVNGKLKLEPDSEETVQERVPSEEEPDSEETPLEVEKEFYALKAENAKLQAMVQEGVPLQKYQILMEHHQALQQELESCKADLEEERRRAFFCSFSSPIKADVGQDRPGLMAPESPGNVSAKHCSQFPIFHSWAPGQSNAYSQGRIWVNPSNGRLSSPPLPAKGPSRFSKQPAWELKANLRNPVMSQQAMRPSVSRLTNSLVLQGSVKVPLCPGSP
jgi:hypothetical protein